MSSRRCNRFPRTLSRLIPCSSSPLPLAVFVAGLVSLASCSFFSPPPMLSNLAKNATATCTGSCTPSGNDPATCNGAKICTLACPTRTDFPARQNPLTEWTAPTQRGPGCLSNTSAFGIPAVANSSNGFLEVSYAVGTAGCAFSKSSAPTTSGHLAVSMWIKPAQCNGTCPLVQVGSSNGVLLKLRNNTVCLDTICGPTELPRDSWTLIVLRVPGGSGMASFVINGTTQTRQINMPISGGVDVAVGVLPSGNTLSSGDSYQLSDVHHYNDLLTDREIQKLLTNTLPYAGLLTECRCPSTHLQLKPGDSYTCVSSSQQETRRLKIIYNSPKVLVDGNSTRQWMGPDAGDVTFNIDMGVTYQVESFEIQFFNTTPASVKLEFNGIKNVTCSGTACSFSFPPLNTSANPADLSARVASSLTVKLIQPGRNIIITNLTVNGRCNCNGNAEACNTSVYPYGCNCKPETNSEGRQCEHCRRNTFHQDSLFSCNGACNCEASNTVDVNQTCDVNGGACLCKANVENVQDPRCTSCKNWTYGLSPFNPLGCQPCPCHKNGSESCSRSTGTCVCKDNVKTPLCDSCIDDHYDNGPDEGPDVCLPCGCNTAGIKMNTMCNNATGQCDCKDHVQGRHCDECKDGYYSLQVAQFLGCLDCGCNPIGSTSRVCDKVSGQCPCLGSRLVNRTCTPGLERMEPIFGPMSGGTVVTLTGRHLGNSSQVPRVFFGSIVQTVINHNESVIIFRTQKSHAKESLSVQVSWVDFPEAFNLPNQNFTYRSNPVLDNSSVPAQVAMFVSGGCGVSFKGTSFDSVATPYITVNNSNGQSVRAPCRHIAADLRCATPNVSELHDPLNSSLRFGLELDGIVEGDLGPVSVKSNPTLSTGDVEFQYPFKKSITLEGSRLLEGCGRDEISVLIGVTGCSILSLSDSKIECQPPTSPPGGIKRHPLTVKIGSNIEINVGMLVYVDVWKTDIFIGIMCGIGALILLIIVIVIFCCCRNRRKRSMSNGNSELNLVNKNGQTDAPQNQYTTLPLEQLNNGFSASEATIIPVAVVREPKDAPPPTASEVDLMTEFLNRLEPSLWDGVKSSIISSNDLKLGRVCTARGNYARIIDGTFTAVTAGQRTEKKVTIKTLKEPLPETGALPSWAGEALRECLRLYRHSDDNVLSLIGLTLDKQKFHMVYPFMQNRTLKDHIIDTDKEFSVRQLVEFGLQVAEGLTYLATKDITHRDIAARNCMVDGQQEVKITDAAFCWDFYENEYVYDSERERYMPIRWMAPESLKDGFYDVRSDVWSFGVLLWELLTRGCLPFHEVKDPLVKDYVLEGYVLGQPQNCSDKLYEVMRQCWDLENEHRPHISSIVTSLSAELTGGGVDQEDIYVNLGTVEGFYENQMALGNKSRRRAPPPPRSSQI